MSTWMPLIGATLGALAGTEIARRRCVRTGTTFCFQPLWLYYSLSAAGVAIAMFFVLTAEQALASPSRDAVLALIISACGAFAVVGVQTTIELSIAKRKIKTLQDAARG